jgi:hypothetical protein
MRVCAVYVEAREILSNPNDRSSQPLLPAQDPHQGQGTAVSGIGNTYDTSIMKVPN